MNNLDPQIEGYINRFSEAETLEEMQRVRDEIETLLQKGTDSLRRAMQAIKLKVALSEKIEEVRKKIEQGIELPVRPTLIETVFIPPDPQETKIGHGNGTPLEVKESFPRTLLAFEVLQNLGVPIVETVSFYEGRNTDNMLRSQSYRSIVVPTLNKTILVCDEEGNRTFVVHTADMAESFIELTKEELKEIMNYGMVSDLVWCEPNEWKQRLMELLTIRVDEAKEPKMISKTNPQEKVSFAPEGWMSNKSLAKELDVAFYTILKIAKQYQESNPEWFGKYKAKSGQAVQHYAPELVTKIKEALAERKEAPEGWMTNGGLSAELNVAGNTALSIADQYRKNHPEWFIFYKSKAGYVTEHYAPKLIIKIKEVLAKRQDAPEGWITNSSLILELNVDFYTISKIVDQYRKNHPEWFGNYKSKIGSLAEHFAPELIAKIKKQLAERKEAPEGWITNNALATALGVDRGTILRVVNKYRKNNPEWFKKYTDSINRVREHYAPELVAQIKENLLGQQEAPPGWMTNGGLANELGVDQETVLRISNRYRESRPEWFKEYKSISKVTRHYAPELVAIIRKEVLERQEAPEGWMTNFELSKYLGFNEIAVSKIADKYRESNPDWFKKYKAKNHIISEHYAPNLVTIIGEKLSERQEAPEGWMTNRGLADSLGVAEITIKKIANTYRKKNPEWFKEYKSMSKVTEHYAPGLVAIIRKEVLERQEAPEGWMTNNGLAKELGVIYTAISKIANEYRDSRPEWFMKYKDSINRVREHYSPELIAKICQALGKEVPTSTSPQDPSATLPEEPSEAE
jgi:plasmid maintenance system antidote protein VapI